MYTSFIGSFIIFGCKGLFIHFNPKAIIDNKCRFSICFRYLTQSTIELRFVLSNKFIIQYIIQSLAERG